MTGVDIQVHFAQRRAAADSNAINYDIVFFATLVVNHNSLSVYERDDLIEARANGATIKPALKIFFSNITKLKCKRRIQSEHGNHIGSRVRIYGVFDRDHIECITFKMSTDECERLMCHLNSSSLACIHIS